MNPLSLALMLADDDLDDCLFFKEALSELALAVQLTIVSDGDQLMHVLSSHSEPLPDVLFLDLNMPRKSGLECLVELKGDQNLNPLPVVVFSTYFEPAVADLLHKNGAQYCMRKPADFSQLKQLIQQVLTLLASADGLQPAKDGFVLKGT